MTEPIAEPADVCRDPIYFFKVAAPSILTLSALACSMTAVQLAQSQDFNWSAGLIFLAAIFDAMDGHVARLFQTVSIFGAELDSLCDLVNFGLSPALVMFAWAKTPGTQLRDGGFDLIALWCCCMVFCQACAARLARFNCGSSGPAQQARTVRARSPGSPRRRRSDSKGRSDSDDASDSSHGKGSSKSPGKERPAPQKETLKKTLVSEEHRFIDQSKFFQGVPAPMGAMLGLTPLFWELDMGTKPFGLPGLQVACFMLMVTAVLMVSPLRTLSSKMFMRDPTRDSHLRTKSWSRALMKCAGVALLAAVMFLHPWRTVLVMQLIYIASLFIGPFVYHFYAKR